MDIRIGNDIKLDILLNNLSIYSQDNVKQVQCYLINDNVDMEFNHCGCEFRNRFPREPFSTHYFSTYKCLNTCGKPTYHVHPVNDIPFLGDRYHHRFHNHHNHDDHLYYQHFSEFVYPDGMVNPERQLKYLAYSEVDFNTNIVHAYFPAIDQILLGNYKLLVVYTTYEEGWGTTNMHVHTKDYGDVFTLVDTASGASGNILINVNDWEDPNMATLAGFASSTSIQDVNITTFAMANTDNAFSIDNDICGGYLWVCCPKEAKSFTSGGFIIPMSDTVQFKDRYYCYRSAGQLQKGNVTFKINY